MQPSKLTKKSNNINDEYSDVIIALYMLTVVVLLFVWMIHLS